MLNRKGKFGINFKKFRSNGANVKTKWVCIIGSVSVFFAAVIIRLTAQSDSRALTYYHQCERIFNS